MEKDPVVEARKSPIPAAWKSVKGVTTSILRRPTTPTDGTEASSRPVTPTSDSNDSMDLFCDESAAAGKQVKSVRPKSSRRKVRADVDTGCGMSVSSAESRAMRIERSRKRVESDKKKTRNHLEDYSGSPQQSSRRRERSQSRSPVMDQVKVVHHKRTKKRTSPQRKSQKNHVVSPDAVDLGDADVPLNPIGQDSRQFADSEEDEATIVAEEEPQKKSVTWHRAIKSCSDSIADDSTADGTWTSRCSSNFVSPEEDMIQELMDCGYFCQCLMDEVTPNESSVQ